MAVLLLDAFQADPKLWRDCAHLNRWNPGADATFAGYLESWAEHLRKHGSVARAPAVIAAALGQKLGA